MKVNIHIQANSYRQLKKFLKDIEAQIHETDDDDNCITDVHLTHGDEELFYTKIDR